MSPLVKKPRYKIIKGRHLIEVRVKTAQQLFDARDPAPFRERDLDDDFVDYIEEAAREFTRAKKLKILIYIEEGETKDLSQHSIKDAIHTYLDFQSDRRKSDLKFFLRRAEIFLLIGLVMLVICLSVAETLVVEASQSGILGVLREGIVIFGWVSIWKPLELVLYDWYPLYERLRFNQKLLDSEIEIQFPVVSG